MGNSERLEPEPQELTPSMEKLHGEAPPEKVEDKPSEPLAALLRALSVYKENHPDKYGFGLLKKGEGLPLTEKGKDLAGMITGFWMKESASYDEFCETLHQIREEGMSYFQSQAQQKEKTVFLAVLQSAESRRANVEEKLTKYDLESKFPGLKAQILPWELARMRQRGREMLAVGPPEVIDAIARTLAIEELAGLVAGTKSNLLETTWRKVGGHLGEVRTALDVTLANILPGRTIGADSETPQQALTDLCGAPGSAESNGIVEETGKTAEKLAVLEANPGKVNAEILEETLEETLPEEKSLKERLFDKLSSVHLPKLTPQAKAKLAGAVVAASLLISFARPLAAEAATPRSTPDYKIEFAKSEFVFSQEEQKIREQFKVGPGTIVDVKTGKTPEDFSYLEAGAAKEELEGASIISQVGLTCKLTTLSTVIGWLSSEDPNPFDLAYEMGITDIYEINNFEIDLKVLEKHGVRLETISLIEEIKGSETPWLSIYNAWENALKEDKVLIIRLRAVEGAAHTMSVLAVGHDKDGTPFAILGDPHRGKGAGKWSAFIETGLKKVGDYLKMELTEENWKGLSKNLKSEVWVLSKAEG